METKIVDIRKRVLDGADTVFIETIKYCNGEEFSRHSYRGSVCDTHLVVEKLTNKKRGTYTVIHPSLVVMLAVLENLGYKVEKIK